MKRALPLLLLAACSWTFGGPERPCPPNGWLAAADVTLGAGAAVTGGVAFYPCVGDVDQSDRARAIHCATTAVGAALGVVYGLSARRGLADRRQCRERVPSTGVSRSARPRPPAALDR